MFVNSVGIELVSFGGLIALTRFALTIDDWFVEVCLFSFRVYAWLLAWYIFDFCLWFDCITDARVGLHADLFFCL